MDEPIECTEDDKDAARSAFYYARIALENHGIEPTDDEAACADFVLAIVKYIKAEPNAKNQGDSGSFIAGGSPGLPG